MKIRIANTGRLTRLRNAERYVDTGRAVWVGPHVIQFLTSDHRHVSARSTKFPRYLAGDNGMSTLDNIRRIPVIHPEVLIRGVPTPA